MKVVVPIPRCKFCRRPLKDPESVKRGAGSYCDRKNRPLKKRGRKSKHHNIKTWEQEAFPFFGDENGEIKQH